MLKQNASSCFGKIFVYLANEIWEKSSKFTYQKCLRFESPNVHVCTLQINNFKFVKWEKLFFEPGRCARFYRYRIVLYMTCIDRQMTRVIRRICLILLFLFLSTHNRVPGVWAGDLVHKQGSIIKKMTNWQRAMVPRVGRHVSRLQAKLKIGNDPARPITGEVFNSNALRALIMTLPGVMQRASQATTHFVVNCCHTVGIWNP